jgi:hypothetical protein
MIRSKNGLSWLLPFLQNKFLFLRAKRQEHLWGGRLLREAHAFFGLQNQLVERDLGSR